MADASVSKTDEGNLVRVRLPLSAPRWSCYQLPPPPPPPPPPEKPPPPKPLRLPELGGVYVMALDMLAFIDSRLFASTAACNGPAPTYQVLAALVSMPSNALAHRVTQPNTIA